ncbi:hypothetical protein ACGFX8_37540, partial [Streptomyces sp. NPDC048362]
ASANPTPSAATSTPATPATPSHRQPNSFASIARKDRRYVRRRGIPHTAALEEQKHWRNRGSRGGRLTEFDSERYKKRNTVERTINRLKGLRAVTTRYEKRALPYLGTVTLAAS